MNEKEFNALEVPEWLKKLTLAMLGIPTALLILGIYHGLLQVLYRAGLLQQTSFFGIEYYQGLTMHGVINALVFTTFFEVAFGNIVMAYYLRRSLSRVALTASFVTMLVGTLMAAFPMFTGTASVLYTFYPPLKASPLFYMGAALLIVGSWVAYFAWIPPYLAFRRENPKQRSPLAVLGMLVTFTVWFAATIPVAVEVLVFLVPWSLGWTSGVDVTLMRTLFWFFGHPLVYFWLLPSYVMFYVMLPKVAGGKLFSENAGRLAFLLFLILSAPIGIHHQFADPGIGSGYKWFHTFLTLLVAVPSFMTAFTLAASLEHASRERGGTGLFRWWTKLPWRDTDRYLFAYFISGLFLFLFGGITGIMNASASMNHVVHNTSWLPGHFHTTVGGPVFLSFIGMSVHLVTQLRGRPVPYPRLNLAVPYLWMFGVFIFSIGLSVAGIMGQPRRTNLGTTYLNPESPLYQADWIFWSMMGAVGGIIMTVSMVFFFIVFFAALFGGKRGTDQRLSLPTSEPLHEEGGPAWLFNLKPWLWAMGAILIIAYAPPLIEISRGSAKRLAPPYLPSSPVQGR